VTPVRASAYSLRDFAASVFAALGVSPDDARVAADVLVEADLLGFDTHGIAHLVGHPGYVPGLRAGYVLPLAPFEVLRESVATALVDGHGALGAVTATRATDLAIAKAREAGIGAVTVREGRHFGAGSVYALRIAREEMVGVVTTNASPWVVPTFGRERMLGTNPIAVAAPTDDDDRPFVCDVSTSTVAFGQVERALRTREALRPGWAVDADGRPTLDPSVVVREGGLTPLGGTPEGSSHKGYALSTAVDLLTGILSGAGWSKLLPVVTTQAAHTFVALRIDAFADPAVFRRDLGAMLDALRASLPMEGAERVLVPGDREAAARREREAHGVPVPDAVLLELDDLAGDLGLRPLARDGA
jgi:LDH2 family malate/lactate/ureidoglycolate dehydrogenase